MTTADSPTTLDQWLDYQQRVHALGVDLGLARVGEVWRRMGAPSLAPVVITVGGTNGKGSTVAFLEAMLVAAGKRVGCYTSPHLLRYNERVRVGGHDAEDAQLIAAFELIEQARRAEPTAIVPLTYFEFGTLAALWIFAHSTLDVAVLEVGLGGRLDAVNIIAADVAIVTTIDLDHQDWLGDSLDAIAREKAGIFRTGCPAVIADAAAPPALLESAERVGARTIVAGRDYRIETGNGGWSLVFSDANFALPAPTLAAPVQSANAAGAIAALHALRERIDVPQEALAAGIRNASVAARLQRFVRAGDAELVVDVAHNPQAARVLAQWLAQNPPRGRNWFVFGALADKDVAGIVAPLAPLADRWFIASLDGETPRGLPAQEVLVRLGGSVRTGEVEGHAGVASALAAAAVASTEGDRIVAFGSFFVAAAALRWIEDSGTGA